VVVAADVVFGLGGAAYEAKRRAVEALRHAMREDLGV
jgi:hypothetical protein